MTLRCFFCERALISPTIFFKGNPVGSVCAKKHNVLPSTNKRATRVKAAPKPKVLGDKYTRDLFDESNGSIMQSTG
jgi:hypothetical protein